MDPGLRRDDGVPDPGLRLPVRRGAWLRLERGGQAQTGRDDGLLDIGSRMGFAAGFADANNRKALY
ncbi:MAG: hypothetical protein L0H73_07250 [Nitrococcus sp.]|nr:hypothetical protein [Nitrococcus sp.]